MAVMEVKISITCAECGENITVQCVNGLLEVIPCRNCIEAIKQDTDKNAIGIYESGKEDGYKERMREEVKQ